MVFSGKVSHQSPDDCSFLTLIEFTVKVNNGLGQYTVLGGVVGIVCHHSSPSVVGSGVTFFFSGGSESIEPNSMREPTGSEL